MFDSRKHQSLRAFFTMIQVESKKAMNIKVEVCNLSFPKCPRTSIDITWAISSGLINKACCNCCLRHIWYISCITRFCQALSSTKTNKNHWDYVILQHLIHKSRVLSISMWGSSLAKMELKFYFHAFMCNNGFDPKHLQRASS